MLTGRILASHRGPHGWTEPRPAPFAAPGLEADPFFSADGRWLYFISTRATGSTNSQDLDIWRQGKTDRSMARRESGTLNQRPPATNMRRFPLPTANT